MLISLKRLDGTDYLENATARIRLRQRASGVLSVAVKEGKAEIDALPCEPIIVDFGLGRNRKLFMVEPEYQRIGFTENSSSIGIPMDADVELTAEIAIQ